MQVLTRLEDIRNALAATPGVKTCKIGLEADITPDDYPIIRVVPSSVRESRSLGRRRIEALIYFGMPVQAFDDDPDGAGRVRLEKLYATLFEMEKEIRKIIAAEDCLYRETITDEDRLDTYKLMAIKMDVEA